VTIRVLPSAIRDLENGRDFYDAQDLGVGDYFQDCLLSDIDSLVLYGGIHRQVFGFYRCLSKRFPYAIYYRLVDCQVVLIYRVLDCRRDPKRIKRSLGE
jgi:plasmid stabilization system protein ParE